MEALSLCFEIIKREGEKFNVGINENTASQITAATATNVNYDKAHNRCSYLYRCGPINLSFAKDCFTKFFSNNKVSGHLLSSLILNSNLNICSLSQGPVLDCVAFLQSFHEQYKFPLLFKNIKLISKYGAWRNTVNIIHQMCMEGYKDLPINGNIEVIQGDPLVDLNEKLKIPIHESDIVIMMKKLNLQAVGDNPHTIISFVKVFLAALKENTLLFCIDTKPSIAVITEAISAFNGTILFQPTFVNTLIQLEQIDLYKAAYGCTPVLSARGSLLVWKKKSSSLPSPYNFELDWFSGSNETLLKAESDSGYSNIMPKMNCDSQKLPYDPLCSPTPYYPTLENNKAFSLSESFKFEADQLSDCVETVSQNTENFPSPSSCIEECKHVLGTVSTQVVSANKSVQTTSEDSFDDVESVKIAALTEKISNLTQSLKSLLETNEVQDTDLHCQCCLKSRNCTATNSVCSRYSCEHGSSEALFLSKYFNEGLHNSSDCLDNRSLKHNCSNNLHKQSSSFFNQHCSNESLSNLKTNEKCNSSLDAVEISNNQKSVPKLVIPLNNLSGDVIAEIVSLISKSNQNS